MRSDLTLKSGSQEKAGRDLPRKSRRGQPQLRKTQQASRKRFSFWSRYDNASLHHLHDILCSVLSVDWQIPLATPIDQTLDINWDFDDSDPSRFHFLAGSLGHN